MVWFIFASHLNWIHWKRINSHTHVRSYWEYAFTEPLCWSVEWLFRFLVDWTRKWRHLEAFKCESNETRFDNRNAISIDTLKIPSSARKTHYETIWRTQKHQRESIQVDWSMHQKRNEKPFSHFKQRFDAVFYCISNQYFQSLLCSRNALKRPHKRFWAIKIECLTKKHLGFITANTLRPHYAHTLFTMRFNVLTAFSSGIARARFESAFFFLFFVDFVNAAAYVSFTES